MTSPGFMRSPWFKWGLLAVIQLLLISLPLANRLTVQMTGTEVTLAIRPVDPRDLLRGDYVIINLAITRLPSEIAATLEDPVSGETIYLELVPDDKGIAQPTRLARNRADLGALAIEGRVTSTGSASLTIDYGIDAFYLAEGTGKVIETLDTARVHLVAALAPDGQSLPLRLLVDGKPFKSDAAF
ncbi:GDYXXLXY domain-containing protein [Roseibium algae]|uniref:GDYXXLXY domain-containing protein n=1 Tax=Roseibium algae TaxID=3123038 RepID=A0ABU8TGJ0_9HYPH